MRDLGQFGGTFARENVRFCVFSRVFARPGPVLAILDAFLGRLKRFNGVLNANVRFHAFLRVFTAAFRVFEALGAFGIFGLFRTKTLN